MSRRFLCSPPIPDNGFSGKNGGGSDLLKRARERRKIGRRGKRNRRMELRRGRVENRGRNRGDRGIIRLRRNS